LIEREPLRRLDPSNSSMKQKSSSRAEMEEKAAVVFAVKNLFPAEAPTAAMGVTAQM
jgi:hypothetical protein